MIQKIKVAKIIGDGIGPEITEAVCKVLDASGAMNYIEFIDVEVGEKIYNQGHNSGIDDKAWEKLKDVTVLLKAPITTPMGKGVKSLNVTLRKKLGLYANIRPAVSYYPIISNSPKVMDLVVVRENEEDLYAGIEHRQTQDAFTSLKLLTKLGSLKICHYAFEYARVNNRKRVTCMIKDNIMKMTDGMFYSAFMEVAKRYQEIANERYIIDIGAARLASKPENFDVVVTENLYGDIISDITSEIAGSVGIAGSSNIGERYAMFEAIHGSAPAMAGKNTANPTAFLNAAVLMLVHLGLSDNATLIKNALLKTLEDGMHTKDLYKEESSKAKLGTQEFANEIIRRLGQKPSILKSEEDGCANDNNNDSKIMRPFNASLYNDYLNGNTEENPNGNVKKIVGVDLFIDLRTNDVSKIANLIQNVMDKHNGTYGPLKLSSIMTLGLKVWPIDHDIILKTTASGESNFHDHWMCRFICIDRSVDANDETMPGIIVHTAIGKLMIDLAASGIDVIKVEKLYRFGNLDGFSAGQGE